MANTTFVRYRRANNPNRRQSEKLWLGATIILLFWVSCLFLLLYKASETSNLKGSDTIKGVVTRSTSSESVAKLAPMSKIAYGTRGGKEQTAELVREAILAGFRQIVTSSHHQNHNETGVGVGWKLAAKELKNPQLTRNDLFLQSMFVPFNGADFRRQHTDPSSNATLPTIADQVRITVEQSLQNLQTTYVDAMLYHNFRTELHPYQDMIAAWRVLEEYVQRGVVRYLGISNCHDVEYFRRLYNESVVKPTIVQNRFHSNRNFDISLRPMFREHKVAVQRFWVLTGNGDGVKRNAEMAKLKGLTPEQLMFAFIMSLGDIPLVGAHSLQHLKDDIQVANTYERVFDDINGKDLERATFARNLGIKE